MARNKEVEAQIKKYCGTTYRPSNKGYEFVEPYTGKHGNYPAEIYCDGNIDSCIFSFINNLGLSQDDWERPNIGSRGGATQILLKTEEANKKFKEAIKKAAERMEHEYNARFGFSNNKKEDEPASSSSILRP
jgi:hypothetical protein